MQIYIDNKLVVLKQGTSIEYISENRLFSGADGYTLSIELPLKDCPQNLAIFGNINRTDVETRQIIFDCTIRCRGLYKSGCVTITEINESTVKLQFLDGRSQQNFDFTFEKIYINELNLGQPPTLDCARITPAEAWDVPRDYPEAVALPWVSAAGRIQNLAECSESMQYYWRVPLEGSGHDTYNSTAIDGLSWQPFLLHIIHRVCDAVGYRCDISKLDNDDRYKHLLICNALPYAWEIPQYARALPHWTVDEFFSQLEIFLGGEFTINHKQKLISFDFVSSLHSNGQVVHIDKVVNEHSTEIDAEDDSYKYLLRRNYAYKERSDDQWKYLNCNWYIDTMKESAQVYNTLNSLIASNRSLRTWDGENQRGSTRNKLLYAQDVNAYFIVRAISRSENPNWEQGLGSKYTYKCILQPVNLLGERIFDEDADQQELKIVPARVDYTQECYGNVLFLENGSYSEDDSGRHEETSGTDSDSNSDIDADSRKEEFRQTPTAQAIEQGKKDKVPEYYDCIYIGYWNGELPTDGHLPVPMVADIEIDNQWNGYRICPFSFRLDDRAQRLYFNIHDIEEKQKTNFKFLTDTLPDVRSTFIIRGKRYVCEKLTATLTENGMSQLVKGTFYPVKEQ